MVVAFYCTIDLPVSAHTTIGVNLTEDNTYVNIYTLRLGLHFKTHNIYFNFPLYNCDPFIKQSMSSYVKNDNTWPKPYTITICDKYMQLVTQPYNIVVKCGGVSFINNLV